MEGFLSVKTLTSSIDGSCLCPPAGRKENFRQKFRDGVALVPELVFRCADWLTHCTDSWFLKSPHLFFLVCLSFPPSDQTFIKCLQRFFSNVWRHLSNVESFIKCLNAFIKCLKTFIKRLRHLSFILIFRLVSFKIFLISHGSWLRSWRMYETNA